MVTFWMFTVQPNLTLALSPEGQSARMSDIKNGTLDLDGKVQPIKALGFKGLNIYFHIFYLHTCLHICS